MRPGRLMAVKRSQKLRKCRPALLGLIDAGFEARPCQEHLRDAVEGTLRLKRLLSQDSEAEPRLSFIESCEGLWRRLWVGLKRCKAKVAVRSKHATLPSYSQDRPAKKKRAIENVIDAERRGKIDHLLESLGKQELCVQRGAGQSESLCFFLHLDA